MRDYTYCVSLIITHPSITPDEITKSLGIIPSSTKKIGEHFETPAGKKLKLKSDSNHWSLTPHREKMLKREYMYLDDYIASLNEEFSKHKSYFNYLVETGGYVQYFIGWFEHDDNLCITLTPELMKSTSELNIAIDLHAYVS